MFLGVLLDGVVGEVGESVVNVVQVVLLVCEAEVALVVEPYFGWVEVLNDDPLPNIELPPLDQHRVLDVLLHHELCGPAHAVVNNIINIVETSDSPSPG